MPWFALCSPPYIRQQQSTAAHMPRVDHITVPDVCPHVTLDRQTILQHIEEKASLLLRSGRHGKAERSDGSFVVDGSVYTGLGGLLATYLKLARVFEREGRAEHKDLMLREAGSLLHVIKGIPDEPGYIGYYCGRPGILLLQCVYAKMVGAHREVQEAVNSLLRIDTTGRCEDEMLFGRAGFIYCLLTLRKEFPELAGDSRVTNKLAETAKAAVRSGEQQSRSQGSPMPLIWSCYGSFYHGAAHGHAGILAMLLHCWGLLDAREQSLVQATLNALLGMGPAHGRNLPTTLWDTPSETTHYHWCHGAPGLVYTLVLANQILGDASYLRVAESMAQLVWSNGVLLRGTGLCHGISGNAYPFLTLYRATNDARYLDMALYYAHQCLTPSTLSAIASHPVRGRRVVGVPDTPYSLMEGLAGEVCYFADLLNPHEARFPGWEI